MAASRSSQRYAEIDPTLVQEVVGLSRREQEHRHKHDDALLHQAIENNQRANRRADWGTFAGLTALAIGYTAAVICAIYGQGAAAAVIGGTSTVSIVAVFVTGRLTESSAKKQPTPSKTEDADDR